MPFRYRQRAFRSATRLTCQPPRSCPARALTSMRAHCGWQPNVVIPANSAAGPSEFFKAELGIPVIRIPHSYGGCGQHGTERTRAWHPVATASASRPACSGKSAAAAKRRNPRLPSPALALPWTQALGGYRHDHEIRQPVRRPCRSRQHRLRRHADQRSALWQRSTCPRRCRRPQAMAKLMDGLGYNTSGWPSITSSARARNASPTCC